MPHLDLLSLYWQLNYSCSNIFGDNMLAWSHFQYYLSLKSSYTRNYLIIIYEYIIYLDYSFGWAVFIFYFGVQYFRFKFHRYIKPITSRYRLTKLNNNRFIFNMMINSIRIGNRTSRLLGFIRGQWFILFLRIWYNF